MSGNHSDDDHVTALLGAYAMDLVDDEERVRILRHLPRCGECRDDFDYISVVPSVLDLLTPADVEDLLPRPDSPPAVAKPMVVDLAAARRGRARRPIALTAAAAALVVLVGLGGWLLIPQPSTRTPTLAPQPVALASAGHLGISVSLSLTPHVHSVDIEATVRGLEPGRRYQLLAVTADGQTLTVSLVDGQAGTQVTRATLPLPADQISFFALVGPDADVLVTVPFASGGSSATPSR